MVLSKFNSSPVILQIAVILLFFSFGSMQGQENEPVEGSNEVVASIFEDVWLPFMESYRALDVEKFKSIHAKDLTRVSISRNQIQSYADYFTQMEGVFKQVKESGRQMDIQFSIITSATGSHKAYQTGYYCFRSRASASEEFQARGYGFFNVLLTKENGTWKISLDSDKRADITEEEFNKSGTIYSLD
ncbi:MAG: nuclear transport factor 2 family protein [Bacteroidota bacterium]